MNKDLSLCLQDARESENLSFPRVAVVGCMMDSHRCVIMMVIEMTVFGYIVLTVDKC